MLRLKTNSPRAANKKHYFLNNYLHKFLIISLLKQKNLSGAKHWNNSVQETTPSEETLVAELNINVEELTHLQSLTTARYTRSLDQAIHEDGESLHQRLSNDNNNGDHQQLRAHFTNLLRNFIKTYRRRSGQVVPREILMAEEEDLADVAQRFGLSREEVREQQEEMRRRLREFLLENGIDESFFD